VISRLGTIRTRRPIDTARPTSLEINRDIVRWLLLIALLPIGWPFVKTLWRDFNSALRDEGGLFGRTPSAREVEEILAQKKHEPETLISESWVRPGDVRKPRLRGKGGSGPASAPRMRTGRKPGGVR
jgi:hypothetical protein